MSQKDCVFIAHVHSNLPVVPHKAVAEVSMIRNLYERFVVVRIGWQSDPTDGLKSGWRQRSAVVVALVVPMQL